MASFTNQLFSAFRKRARGRSAPARIRASALRVESLEQRSLLTSIVPIGAPLPDSPVADDIIEDGQIITGENFDSANTGDLSIVRKLTGRTNYQPASASPYGGGGRDVLLGGLGDDLLSRTTASGHMGEVNALLGGGSVHFNRLSGVVNAAMGDGSVRFISDSIDTVLASDLQDDADTDAAAGSNHSEWKYVPVRRTASTASGDTGTDVDGRQITYTGLEQAATDAVPGSFFAFDSGFRGGVQVAAGDVNGDALDDIITGAGGGAPGGHVRVIDGNRIGGFGNDWLSGGTGRDNVSTSAAFESGNAVW